MKKYVILEANGQGTAVIGDTFDRCLNGFLYVMRDGETVYVGAPGGWWSIEVREMD